MRCFLKKQAVWGSGAAFGLGHGALESILLTGVSALAALLLYGGDAGTEPILMVFGGLERIMRWRLWYADMKTAELPIYYFV